MSRLFAFPASRAKFLVFGISLLALLIIPLATNLPGKFTDAEENDSASFLPGDAESTAALEITDRLQGGEIAPTIIVYRRDGGLTAQDRQKIERDVQALNRTTQRYRNTTPFGNPREPRASQPYELSRDGTTALVGNEIQGTGDGADIIDPVEDYRELVSDPGGGLQAKVAGPAGISADAIKVFEGINGTLLLAAFGLVVVLLILIYRSPLFWFFPLLAVVVAEVGARAFGWLLTEVGVTVNGQSSAILSILVIGAGTDYALLLVSRYREELRRHEDKHEAMALALRTAGPAIFASGLTVCAALLSLSLAKVNGTAGLGPIGAMGIAVAMLVMLTFLPALLVMVGRRPFWPFVPHFEGADVPEQHGVWQRIGQRVAARPRLVTAASTGLLILFAVGLLNFSTGLTQSNTFRDDVEAIAGQELIAQAFPSGQSAPTDLVLPDARPGQVEQVAQAAAGVDSVAAVPPRPVNQGDGDVQLNAFLEVDPYSTEAYAIVPALRQTVQRVAPTALVGGPSAIEYDLRQAAADDNRLLIPIALVIVFLILVGLLRAILAPVLLILTVVLSFLAALGVGAVVFDVIFGFPGSDPSLPLFAFIFLVALGVDYNIFLMARVREETLKHGTRPGMLRGLAVTGGVITSAGIVLAGTFLVLGVLPLVFLTEIGFVIAFGVLLDTFLVRSVLVPALVFDIGLKVWWPSKLAQEPDRPSASPPDTNAPANGAAVGPGARAAPVES
ncbi:MAG: MMPL family transporter [Solirubrobacterales bacterium]|nr:MMPL family transporter [Solirubrobacterales bacterium]